MTNIIRLSDRLARLEARRREHLPDQRRLAEAEARLIARCNAVRTLEDLLAFRAEIEAVRRSSR